MIARAHGHDLRVCGLLHALRSNPDTHIEAYGSNFASAAALYDQKAYVRPADNKGGDGGTLQRWKSTLREDFATDQDNYGNLVRLCA